MHTLTITNKQTYADNHKMHYENYHAVILFKPIRTCTFNTNKFEHFRHDLKKIDHKSRGNIESSPLRNPSVQFFRVFQQFNK